MFIDTYNLGKTAKDTLWKQIPDCTAPPEILFCISTENKEIDLNALKELKDALSDLLFDVSPLSDYIEKSKSRRLVLSLGVKG
ncbi:MAG: hypothetical protein GTN82_22030, partial [Candidatus Aminicenantes bacterium]|nr:hypothetical protein [Candidatus Aminicenantes bacterium]